MMISPPLPPNATSTASTTSNVVLPQPPSSLPPSTSSNAPSLLTSKSLEHFKFVSDIPSYLSPSAAESYRRLLGIIEKSYYIIGHLAESMNDHDRAMAVYERLLHWSRPTLTVLTQLAHIYRTKEMYDLAIQCLQQALSMDPPHPGELQANLGHCYLMKDDVEAAFQSYQQALNHLPNPTDAKLWYGIGILYDRWACYENAEIAFTTALKHAKHHFDKTSEVCFRLGVIYKQLGQFDTSLHYFQQVLENPPSPLTTLDVQFQMGHCHEQQGDVFKAKEIYESILNLNPTHTKALQQLGWLVHASTDPTVHDEEKAMQLLEKATKIDPYDAHAYYLLGRCHMAHQRYNEAHDAYQQAVYRDPKNPSFWCSIGVLYFQIKQYRDALEAYTRAIRLNPGLAEVWYDLGTLYESCHNQLADALDAYDRAHRLDPDNPHIQHRLQLVKQAMQRPQLDEDYDQTGSPPSKPPANKRIRKDEGDWRRPRKEAT